MWFKIQNQQVNVWILAKPNAKKTALLSISEKELHIALRAKPQKGEANKELISYLSQLFDLPKSQIILKSGEGNKYKRVIMPLTEKIQRLLDGLTKFK
jgi:hypothetical protein